MNYRTVVMYTEIGSFVTCVVGWILVCSTLPMEYWTFSEVASTVITTDHFHSNLWKDCTTDSTGMVDCKEFPTLLGLQPYIHLCRVLIIISILLGLFGAILALVGMKCTKLGGSEVANARVTFVAGINYLTSGLCSIFAYSLYGYKVVVEFFDPNYYAQKRRNDGITPAARQSVYSTEAYWLFKSGCINYPNVFHQEEKKLITCHYREGLSLEQHSILGGVGLSFSLLGD
ncbi:claudin-10 isoform X2 [Ictalurus punctatus]|uniref:Claudin n=1 Tax=Ictalurus punctatus TaxID=7998 RepID=A0A2D0RZZ0_ICTPU|nr:claudin-10 isoform X2 [Ictalurus punctatus]